MSKDESPLDADLPPTVDEPAEQRIATRVVDELIRRLVMSLPTADNDPPRVRPKKTAPETREPLGEATLRAQARERLRDLRAGRR